jgi:hypothetical protein
MFRRAPGHAEACLSKRRGELTSGNRLGGGRVHERLGNPQVRKLPDTDHGAEDEEAVNDGLKEAAFFFFRPHKQSVSGLRGLIEGAICFHKIDSLNAMPVPPGHTKL